MPVSTSVHISHCLSWIVQLAPASVLDVGCGFGTWGFLCREHLDVMQERVMPDEWKVRIDGIELFEPYIQDHQRALYSSISIGDIRELAPAVDTYDLIIAGDVIEHLEKDEGEQVLRRLYEKAVKALLVNIPLDGDWEHSERHGNPGELHRSQWCVEDFLPYPAAYEIFTLPFGTYGSFLCRKDCTDARRVEGLVAAAEYAEKLGRLDAAEQHLRTAHVCSPGDPSAATFLADVLIQCDNVSAAADVLEKCLASNKSFFDAHLALARLYTVMGCHDEASRHRHMLLESPDVPDDLKAAARALAAS